MQGGHVGRGHAGPLGRTRARAAIGLAVILLAALGPGRDLAGAAPTDLPVTWQDTTTPLPRVGDADPETKLTVRLGLRNADEAGLTAAAATASDPTSPSYGRFLGLAEIDARFGAPTADRDLVLGALAGRGITGTVDVTGSRIDAPMTIAQARSLFSTPWGVYQPEGGDGIPLPDDAPSLPPELVGPIDLVAGLSTTYPSAYRPAPPSKTPIARPGVNGGTPTRTGTPVGCTEALDASSLNDTTIAGQPTPAGLFPNQLADAYGLTPLRDRGIDGTGVRVAVVGQVVPYRSDLDAFARCFGLDTGAVALHGEQEVEPGPGVAFDAGTEATLDVEILLAAAPGLERLDVYGVAESDLHAGMLEMAAAPLEAAADGRPLPHLVSMSWGDCEPDWAGDPVQDLVEQVLASATLAGVGYQVASGDGGSVGCFGGADLAVHYPGSSAWVTSVGATNLTLDAGNRIVTQGVWNDGTYPAAISIPGGASTGGTSADVGRPSFQQAPGLAAGPGRAVPDVALFGDTLPGQVIYCSEVCVGSGWGVGSGTSAATPLATAALALVTQAVGEARVPRGDTVRLGLAAPLLWELGRRGGGDGLRDVTIGTNDVGDLGCCEAKVGYDLASGWGSIDAAELADALAPRLRPTRPTEATPARPVAARARFTG